jgi:hypothetical protein
MLGGIIRRPQDGDKASLFGHFKVKKMPLDNGLALVIAFASCDASTS